MYIFKKAQLTPYPKLKEAILLIEKQTKAKWSSVYLNPRKELEISFTGIVTKGQVNEIWDGISRIEYYNNHKEDCTLLHLPISKI